MSDGGGVALDDALISRLRPTLDGELKKHIVASVDCTKDGRRAVAAATGGLIRLIDLESGTITHSVRSLETGVAHAQFTHHDMAILYASNEQDGKIYYHSLFDNRIVHSFEGHTKRVISLSMSPLNDTFLSASLDGHVKLWDLRQRACVGTTERKIAGGASVLFDPSGLIFAAGLASGDVQLFDPRRLSESAFQTFSREATGTEGVPLMRFSPSGQLLAVVGQRRQGRAAAGLPHADVQGEVVTLFDTMNDLGAQKIATLDADKVSRDHAEAGSSPAIHCIDFTPDSRYLIAGCADRAIRAWKVGEQAPIATHVAHASPVHALRWCPTSDVLVSGGVHVLCWQPA